ncbi:MAG: tetratricopeptide repeat protein [Methanomicrobiaceae archaeon]|nr:tetratricopeptide repeat protein [Methanomicrobiaceae archaeon]
MKIKYLIFAIFIAAMLFGSVSAENMTISDSGAGKISLYNSAIDLANEGNLDESLAMLNQAIETDENFTIAYAAKAGVLVAMGDYEGALAAADKATELNPNQADAWVNKATALISLGRFEEGLLASDKAIELEPDYFEAWLNKGTALGGLGRYQEELEASEKAIEINPQSNLAWANKRYAQQMLGEGSGQEQSPMSFFVVITGIFAVLVICRGKKKL